MVLIVHNKCNQIKRKAVNRGDIKQIFFYSYTGARKKDAKVVIFDCLSLTG